MPTDTVTTDGRAASEKVSVPSRDDDALRDAAGRKLERIRKFRLYVFVYLLAMLVLTPIWIVTQYETADGWPEHLSTRSRYPGDWDPWIIWVALVGAVLVAIAGYRAYVDRPRTEREIGREDERLKSNR